MNSAAVGGVRGVSGHRQEVAHAAQSSGKSPLVLDGNAECLPENSLVVELPPRNSLSLYAYFCETSADWVEFLLNSICL